MELAREKKPRKVFPGQIEISAVSLTTKATSCNGLTPSVSDLLLTAYSGLELKSTQDIDSFPGTPGTW